jgi:hypothetical protein
MAWVSRIIQIGKVMEKKEETNLEPTPSSSFRYWALAIPVWIMTLVWFTFIYYMTVNLMNTPPFDSYDCITGNKDGC